MDRIHTDRLRNRKENRRQDHDIRNVVKDHTEYQKNYIHDEDDRKLVTEGSEDGLRYQLRVLHDGQAATECSGTRDDKENRDVGLRTLHKHGQHILHLNRTIDEQGYNQSIYNRNSRGFRRRADTTVDRPEDDDRRQKGSEALLKYRTEAELMKCFIVFLQLFLIFTRLQAVQVAAYA